MSDSDQEQQATLHLTDRRQIFLRIVALLSTIFLGTVVSILIFLYISETYYFDKLVYNKSEWHGYSYWHTMDFGVINSQKISKYSRLSDLKDLLNRRYYDKKQGEIRVVLIGDSMFFGLGVRKSQTLASQLQKKLNEAFANDISVVNLSFPGDTVYHNFLKLKLAEDLEGDIYIVGLVDNDYDFSGLERYPHDENHLKMFEKDCVGEYYYFNWEAADTFDKVVSIVYEPSFSDDYKNKCVAENIVAEMIKSEKRILFFPLSPTKNVQFSSTSQGHEVLQYALIIDYIQSIQRSGGQVIEYPTSQLTYKQVSDREGHPSAETHGQYADILFQEIVNRLDLHQMK